MGKPYVCLVCKTRLLLSRQRQLSIRHLRSHSTQTPFGESASRPKDGIAGILGDSAWAQDSGHGAIGSRTQPRDGSLINGAKSNVGRYSRKELRPEELLNRLDEPWPSRRAVGRSSTRQNPNSYQADSHELSFDTKQRPQQRHGYVHDELHPEVEEIAKRYCDFMQSHDVVLAWQVLHDLDMRSNRLPSKEVAKFIKSRRFSTLLSPLLWELHRYWLQSLSSGDRSDGSPRPSEVLLLLQRLGISITRRMTTVLSNTAVGVYELRHQGRFSNPESDREGVEELMRLWNLAVSNTTRSRSPSRIFQHSKVPHTEAVPISSTERLDWNILPSLAALDSWIAESKMELTMENVLLLLVNQIQKRELDSAGKPRLDLTSPALLTLDLLRAGRHERPESYQAQSDHTEHALFAQFLEAVLQKNNANISPATLIRKRTSGGAKSLVQAYTETFSRLGLGEMPVSVLPSVGNAVEGGVGGIETLDTSHDAHAEPAGTSKVSSPAFAPPAAEPSSSHLGRFTTTNIRRLGRAIEKQDLYLAQKIRREVGALAGAQGSNSTAVPLELYEHLMMAFLSLRDLQSAIEIWNQVFKAGYKLTARTYTMMMRGAVASRDLSGMQTFWDRMHRAGIRPDHHAWSVRIFGLIKLKHVRAGMQALSDMGQEWLAAARAKTSQESASPKKSSSPRTDATISELVKMYPGPVDGVPKPTIVIVNSAVSALALVADSEIPKVLSWARSFGVELDLRTYNALLNIAMRHLQPEEALNILRLMQERGIAADSTTWTVLLTALFEGEFLNDLDASAQQDKILAFLATLESNDSGVDEQGYALVIDRLLKQYDNSAAAEAVLQRMIAAGRKPTVHIYTILMTSYFQKKPQPDLAAVEKLWRQISSENQGFGAVLDSVFFDRMIEGYAAHHRTVGIRAMLGFLERMTQEGKQPGWKALESVARALAERSEWERLRGIVLDVRRRLESARGATQHAGQRDFWQFVLSTGLLKDEGITTMRQIMSDSPKQSPLAAAAVTEHANKMAI